MIRPVHTAALLSACAALFAPCAGAFDGAAWLARRDDMSGAERLRAIHAAAAAAIAVSPPVEDVEMPMEYWPDGRAKTVMHAARGSFSQDRNFVTAEDVLVKRFREDGTLEGEIHAEACTLDRKTREAWAEGSVEMEWDGYKAKGCGIYFSFSEEFIKITSQPEIRTKAGKFNLEKVL